MKFVGLYLHFDLCCSLSELTVTYGNITETLRFVYGSSGPAAVIWNGTYYYYLTNLQGDVVGIADSTGAVVVVYSYDAWGNLLSTSGTLASTLGVLNPLRYRGYVYDAETALYYLQTRYYAPEIGRFVNADAFVSTGHGILGNNMFAYCGNEPVGNFDPYGKSGLTATLAGWISSAWWLTLVDGPLPIGDIIYAAGCVALSLLCIIEAVLLANSIINKIASFKKEKADTTPSSDDKSKDKEEPAPPEVDYPGDDSTKAPDGYKWTGKDPQGGEKGGYKNPKGKDSWHPDLNHPNGVDPHWDYNDGNGHKWRVFPDNTIKFVK